MAEKYKLPPHLRKKYREAGKLRRKRIADAGLKEIRVIVHPDDAAQVRRLARELLEGRA